MKFKSDHGKKNISHLHPYFFVISLILFVYGRNSYESPLYYVARMLVLSLIAALVVQVIFRAISKDTYKAAVLTTLLLISLFVYDPIFAVFDGLALGGVEVGRHRFVLPVYILTLLLGFVSITKSPRSFLHLSSFLNTAMLLMVLMTSLQTALFVSKTESGDQSRAVWEKVIERERSLAQHYKWQGESKAPDIYYIVLDGHARQDIFERDYRAQSDLVQQLRERGFFVAEDSRCNYPNTYFSMASALNYEYMPTLLRSTGASRFTPYLLREMIGNSKVCRVLKDQGYRFVYFPSGFNTCPSSSQADHGQSYYYSRPNAFDYGVLDSSWLSLFSLDARLHAKYNMLSVRELRKVPRVTAPTFAYIHFPCPHPPYVFERDGSSLGVTKRSSVEPGQMYIDQLHYTDSLMLGAIDHIIESSLTPPIIVIQSDHGPDGLAWCFKDSQPAKPADLEKWAIDVRTGILNAYYLPSGAKEKLYDSITPVNTFRVLLNEYFGAEFALLPDEVFYPTCGLGVNDWNFSIIFNFDMKRVSIAEGDPE